MNVIRRSEQKIHYAEEKITVRPGKDFHAFEELDGNEHDNPRKFCNEQELYHVGDEISI
jgi:hypothetical protein